MKMVTVREDRGRNFKTGGGKKEREKRREKNPNKDTTLNGLAT